MRGNSGLQMKKDVFFLSLGLLKLNLALNLHNSGYTIRISGGGRVKSKMTNSAGNAYMT